MTTNNQPERVAHRMERTLEVTADPNAVWDAIATAQGISAWMVPTRLEPCVGGAVSFDLGEFESNGVITDYSPNQRFAYEEPWPIADEIGGIPTPMTEWFHSLGVTMEQVRDALASASPIATEFLIESVSGGTCVIRVVSSAYASGADWENEFLTNAFEGWAEMLDNLAKYLSK